MSNNDSMSRCGRRLLRCGTSIRLMTAVGQSHHIGTLATLAACPLLPPIPTELIRHNKASRRARRRHLRSLAMINFSLLARIFRFGRHSMAAATAPLRRRNLEGRFVLCLERHRARDKAFLGGGIVQA